MSDEKKERRINVDDISATEQELSAEEAKNVQGGAWHEAVLLGDVAAARKQTQDPTAPRDPADGLATGKG